MIPGRYLLLQTRKKEVTIPESGRRETEKQGTVNS